MRFLDRADAGRSVADLLQHDDFDDPVVLGLPRGGVPIAYEVAVRLGAPLDVFVARKIGAPHRPELGIGAIAEGGTIVLTEHLVAALQISRSELDELVRRGHEELDRRVERYRGGRPLPLLSDRDVILVDDGLATGVTAEASVRALLAHRPRRLVLAVPVCAPGSAQYLAELAEVVCLATPAHFGSVGLWYEVFDQIPDETVLELLELARAARAAGCPSHHHLA